MILNISLDEGLELDDNSEDSEGSEDFGDNAAEEHRPCIDPLCGWSKRQGSIFFIEKSRYKLKISPQNSLPFHSEE